MSCKPPPPHLQKWPYLHGRFACAETNVISRFLFLRFLFIEIWSILNSKFTESSKYFDLNNLLKMSIGFVSKDAQYSETNNAEMIFRFIFSFLDMVDFLLKITSELGT